MRKKALILLSMSLLVTAAAAPSQAIALKAKVTKPAAPTIVSVTSSKPKNGKVNVTVRIALPTSNGGSKITGSKVTFAGKSCTMKNSKTTCTIRGISKGKSLKIVATSKNKKGFGLKSKTTKYVAGTEQLRFNLKNAVAVALSSSTRALSNGRSAVNTSPKLIVTNAAGTISNGVVSGSAPISNFMVAPNGNLFVLFQVATELNGVQCLLAEVDKSLGIPVCIDGSLDRISWSGGQRYRPIQFDESGAIYYKGTSFSGTSSKTVLRKYQNGQTTDLINDFVDLNFFAVLPTGGVIITGTTNATGMSWTRRIESTGGIETLFTTWASSIDKYADGNIYIGIPDNNYPDRGIAQFNVQVNALSDSFWIGGRFSNKSPVNNIETICPNDAGGTLNREFCGWYGTQSNSLHNPVGGKTFMIAGSSASEGLLVQVYPTLYIPSTSIKKISKSTTLGAGIVISGLDASNNYKTVYFNSDTGNETTLIPTSSEIEIYHMTYNAATNKMMFDGLRFADNKYVFGQVDLGTNQVTIFSTLTSKWDDFQGFQ